MAIDPDRAAARAVCASVQAMTPKFKHDRTDWIDRLSAVCIFAIPLALMVVAIYSGGRE